MIDMARHLTVVAAVIVDQGRVFACRRAAGRASALKWEFPGGKVEAGENPREALARELDEELNIAVELGELIHRARTSVGPLEIDLSCYEASVVGPLPERSTDHDQLGWFEPHDLLSLEWAEPDVPAVHAVARRLGPEAG